MGFKLTIDPRVAATFRGRASGALARFRVPDGPGLRPELAPRRVERELVAREVARQDLVEDMAHGQILPGRSAIARRGTLTITAGSSATCGNTSTGVRGPISTVPAGAAAMCA